MMGGAEDAGQRNAADDLLYPASEPFNQGYLKTRDKAHELFYEEFGRPDGEPIVFLHGGPAAGNAPWHHRFFDPDFFRIVIYDQRAAPRSRPPAKAEKNNPGLLVDDNDHLRETLGLDAWHVFGGSWGSTLAMLYAQKYPKRVRSLILRGVWFLSQKEIDHFIHDMGRIFPDAGRKFVEHLTPAERKDPLKAYYKRLMDADPEIHNPAAAAFVEYELSCSFLKPISSFTPDGSTLSFGRIEALYMHKHAKNFDIKKNLKKIADIPTQIVQGRYDVVCPSMSAYELSRALNDCRLDFTLAGHSAAEYETMKLLRAACDRIRETGKPLLDGPPSAQ